MRNFTKSNIKEILDSTEKEITEIRNSIEPCDDYDALVYISETYAEAFEKIKALM